jgi:GNAT superfamily N-acetyltransferase
VRDHSNVSEAIEIRSVPADDPLALALVQAMVDDLERVYGGFDKEGPTATPEEMSPPRGAFVVVYAEGEPVAGGGVKRLDSETGEIKRMYVVPEARSRGHARRLLYALEDAARELGYRRLRLDTGPLQPHARALYESEGYREIPDYNANPYASFWGEKEL